MDNLRDRCCWRGCDKEADLIFMGAGLCDEHFALAGSSYKSSYEYAVDRVEPEAAAVMRETHQDNLKRKP